MKESQRPHMGPNDFLGPRTDPEVPPRVLRRNAGMMIPMQTIPVCVPVIEKIVMQERSGDQPPLIGTRMPFPVQAERLPRHIHAVLIRGDPTMLDKPLHTLAARIRGQWPDLPVKIPFLILR